MPVIEIVVLTLCSLGSAFGFATVVVYSAKLIRNK
jgi:hypothetical protein